MQDAKETRNMFHVERMWDLDTLLGRSFFLPEAFPSGGCGRRWAVPDILGSFVVVVDVVKSWFFFGGLLAICSGKKVPSFVVVFMIWDDFFTINMNVMKVIYKGNCICPTWFLFNFRFQRFLIFSKIDVHFWLHSPRTSSTFSKKWVWSGGPFCLPFGWPLTRLLFDSPFVTVQARR